jgi:hypothetical protein
MPFVKIKKMETRLLHNSEMKKLVCVLRGVPTPHSSYHEPYVKEVKEAIKHLPGRLRSSLLSISATTSSLCPLHKGLDVHLVNDIWSWVRHEFDRAIGKLLYPLIMAQKLTIAEELKLRQMEPVLQMWRSDFKTAESAPPDREPINKGSRWAFEVNQCSACMLARIVSDEDVLFALFAGMIGHFHTHKLTSRRFIMAELSVANLEEIKSKRVRFVRYWLRASSRGDTLLFEAAELGIKLKNLYKEWKDTKRSERVSLYRGRHSLDDITVRGSMEEARPQTSTGSGRWREPVRSSESNAGPETTRRYGRNDPNSRNTNAADPKIGPVPRPNNVQRLSPLEPLGFNMAGYCKRFSTESSRPLLDPEPRDSPSPEHDSDSDSTIYPEDSISVAPLRIAKGKQPEAPKALHPDPFSIPAKSYPPHARRDSHLDVPQQQFAERCSKSSNPPSSVWKSYALRAPASVASLSTATVKSYRAGPTNDRTSIATSKSRVKSYKNHVPKDDPFQDRLGHDRLPLPRRQSMYFGYDNGDVDCDPFEDADEPLPGDDEDGEEPGSPMPRTDHIRGNDDCRGSEAGTHWSSLY